MMSHRIIPIAIEESVITEIIGAAAGACRYWGIVSVLSRDADNCHAYEVCEIEAPKRMRVLTRSGIADAITRLANDAKLRKYSSHLVKILTGNMDRDTYDVVVQVAVFGDVVNG